MSNYDQEGYPVGRQWQARQIKTIIGAKHRLPYTWVTAEGEVIEMARMNNSHLRNTIQMLRRTALRKLVRLADVTFDGAQDNEVTTFDQLAEAMMLLNVDDRATSAWGAVYDELISEALCRSDGDLEEWLAR